MPVKLLVCSMVYLLLRFAVIFFTYAIADTIADMWLNTYPLSVLLWWGVFMALWLRFLIYPTIMEMIKFDKMLIKHDEENKK